jgi:hypothetical protein
LSGEAVTGVKFALRILSIQSKGATNMTISYEPNSDVLTISTGAIATQTQVQGTVTVGFDANNAIASVVIPAASTALWEHGGTIQVALPPATVTQTVVVERIIER